MEHTNEIKQENRGKKDLAVSVAFIAAIFLVCFLLVIVIIVLLKNIDEIKTDPIIYGMEKKGYSMCACSDDDGKRVDYTIGVPYVFDLNEVQVIDGAG